MMKSSTDTLIKALAILATDIQSEDGVANACIFEASQRLQEQEKRIAELEKELQQSTDQNDLVLDEFIRVKCLTDNTEIHQLCERAHIRMRQNVPVIERNHRMEKRIAELERERDDLQAYKDLAIELANRKGYDSLAGVFDNWEKRDLEQQIKALDDYAEDIKKAADDTAIGAESMSRGASIYNWLSYFSQSTRGRAQQLRKQAEGL